MFKVPSPVRKATRAQPVFVCITVTLHESIFGSVLANRVLKCDYAFTPLRRLVCRGTTPIRRCAVWSSVGVRHLAARLPCYAVTPFGCRIRPLPLAGELIFRPQNQTNTKYRQACHWCRTCRKSLSVWPVRASHIKSRSAKSSMCSSPK